MDFMLGIEVTRHCYVDAGRPRQREASRAEIEGWLDGAAANGVDSIGWPGGEPLLHRGLERLAALKAAGLRIVQVSLDTTSD